MNAVQAKQVSSQPLTKSSKDTLSSNSQPSSLDVSRAKNLARTNPMPEVKNSTDINKYMRLISRLENQVKGEAIDKKELNRMLSTLEKKILALGRQEREKIIQTAEFKNLDVKDLRFMQKRMLEMIENKDQRKTLFDFLNSKDFISIIREKPLAPQTYSHFAS